MDPHNIDESFNVDDLETRPFKKAKSSESMDFESDKKTTDFVPASSIGFEFDKQTTDCDPELSDFELDKQMNVCEPSKSSLLPTITESSPVSYFAIR
jgi:hypothetical protein